MCIDMTCIDACSVVWYGLLPLARNSTNAACTSWSVDLPMIGSRECVYGLLVVDTRCYSRALPSVHCNNVHTICGWRMALFLHA